MAINATGSQVADRGSSIRKSVNESNISIKKIRTETVIISFIVGTISSLVASYVFEYWLK